MVTEKLKLAAAIGVLALGGTTVSHANNFSFNPNPVGTTPIAAQGSADLSGTTVYDTGRLFWNARDNLSTDSFWPILIDTSGGTNASALDNGDMFTESFTFDLFSLDANISLADAGSASTFFVGAPPLS